MMRHAKLIFSVIGSMIALCGVGYVGIQLYQYSGEIQLSELSHRTWFVIILLSFFYALANGLLALAWGEILEHVKLSASRRWVFRTYFVTQIAKYLPGNIFHLAGRQALGTAAGLEGIGVVKSLFWEMAMLAVASIVFLPLPLTLLLELELNVFGALLGSILVVSVFAITAKKIFGPEIANALVCYGLFLLFTAVSFVVVYESITPHTLDFQDCIVFGTAFVAAWLIGFITPGAPAGLGVRELVLLGLLGQFAAGSDLVLAIVISRFVNATGDLGSFMLGILLFKSKGDPPKLGQKF